MRSLEKIKEILRTGFKTQTQLQHISGYAQATISKALNALSGELLLLPDSSPRQYTLPISDDDSSNIGMVEVDEHGKESFLGELYLLANGQYFVSLISGASSLYLGSNQNGLFYDLPYFIDDLKPQGYIGSRIAKQLHENNSEYPASLKNWQPKHIIKYLIHHGGDLPGNIRLGKGIYHSMRHTVQPLSESSYDFMCQQITEGDLPESSAGGEQQKFTAYSESAHAHVIVKFTAASDDPVTRRWKDLLVTEYHALNVLGDHRIPATEAHLIDRDDRFYLEVNRFDRRRNFGRSSMISLYAIDLEFTGLGNDWTSVAKALTSQGLLNPNDQLYIDFLWQFGRWIGNTDRHLGNISFAIKGDIFSLLPIYDMCSMAIVPKNNQLPKMSVDLPSKLPKDYAWNDLLKITVTDFWNRVQQDERISQELKALSNSVIKKLKQIK